MADTFSISEIVELAVQIEINGKDFYESIAQKSKKKKAKEIFEYLAKEEVGHIKKFRKILVSVHKYEPPEAYPEEYFAYMNTLASQYIFTQKDKGKELAKNVKNEKEAIDFGIKTEKDSITFYEGIKKSVPEKDKKIVDEIIEEEKGHLAKLKELKKDL